MAIKSYFVFCRRLMLAVMLLYPFALLPILFMFKQLNLLNDVLSAGFFISILPMIILFAEASADGASFYGINGKRMECGRLLLGSSRGIKAVSYALMLELIRKAVTLVMVMGMYIAMFYNGVMYIFTDDTNSVQSEYASEIIFSIMLFLYALSLFAALLTHVFGVGTYLGRVIGYIMILPYIPLCIFTSYFPTASIFLSAAMAAAAVVIYHRFIIKKVRLAYYD